MAVIFKHNNKVYQCMSLDKKLKKLKKLQQQKVVLKSITLRVE